MKTDLKKQIEVSRGLRKADLVLKGGRVVNVFSGEIEQADVAVSNGTIAGLGAYDGRTVIDVSAKYIIPGLIDSHLHIESTLLTPPEFARAALPHGITAVVADPHEIANVLGKKGIRYMLGASRGLPLDMYFMLPSCVPASPRETPGAKLTAADLAPFLKHERVLGLAEMMCYPGVLAGDRKVLEKLARFRDSLIDGHAPGLSGKDLAAYIAAGITSDHECVSAGEAREKLRLGMTIFVRESSAAKNLESLLPAVTPRTSRFFCFATDDLLPDDLRRGSINRQIRKAVGLGLDPAVAVQMATINPARYFGMKRKGAVAPGYDADLAVIDGFSSFRVEMVFKTGKLVARDGRVLRPIKRAAAAAGGNSVRIRPLRMENLRIAARTDRARVIELIPNQIETKQAVHPVRARSGHLLSDPDRDILKLVVVERHHATGNIGIGLVKGFGIKSGALASTVAHDAHNIVAVGVDDEDILAAITALRSIRGGFVLVNKRKVVAAVPLPVAGLMSDKPLDAVAGSMAGMARAARHLGMTVEQPFSILSFLALPVVPELKLTDRGLVDVNRAVVVDLFV